MVGLSVILESYRDLSEKRGPQILSKGAMIKPSSSSSSPTTPPPLSNFSSSSRFLENCFLCKRKLMPGKDIYMYKGDRAFCSVECRYSQIFMDEEAESGCTIEYTCSLAATSSPVSSSSSASSSSRGDGGKGGRARANAFAY